VTSGPPIRLAGFVLASLIVSSSIASAQSIETMGVRALGMAGAFVAVADDATAIYWNPAGLATGDFFSAVVARDTRVPANEAPADRAVRGAATAVLIGTPPLGAGYYRLRTTGIARAGAEGGWEARSLVADHVAVTLVQSLGEYLNVGASLKAIRGAAGTDFLPDASIEPALDRAGDLAQGGRTRVDLDLGAIVRFARVRAGLVVRQATRPRFEAEGGASIALPRQVRAGVAAFPRPGTIVAADVDLARTTTVDGERRAVAFGAEQRLGSRLLVRGGTRVQTVGAARPSGSAGLSVAVTALLWVDARVTRGSSSLDDGWGLGLRARF
jgi:hypothetical protein